MTAVTENFDYAFDPDADIRAMLQGRLRQIDEELAPLRQLADQRQSDLNRQLAGLEEEFTASANQLGSDWELEIAGHLGRFQDRLGGLVARRDEIENELVRLQGDIAAEEEGIAGRRRSLEAERDGILAGKRSDYEAKRTSMIQLSRLADVQRELAELEELRRRYLRRLQLVDGRGWIWPRLGKPRMWLHRPKSGRRLAGIIVVLAVGATAMVALPGSGSRPSGASAPAAHLAAVTYKVDLPGTPAWLADPVKVWRPLVDEVCTDKGMLVTPAVNGQAFGVVCRPLLRPFLLSLLGYLSGGDPYYRDPQGQPGLMPVQERFVKRFAGADPKDGYPKPISAKGFQPMDAKQTIQLYVRVFNRYAMGQEFFSDPRYAAAAVIGQPGSGTEDQQCTNIERTTTGAFALADKLMQATLPALACSDRLTVLLMYRDWDRATSTFYAQLAAQPAIAQKLQAAQWRLEQLGILVPTKEVKSSGQA